MKLGRISFLTVILSALVVSAAYFSKGYLGIFIFSLIINGIMAVSFDIPGRSLGLISLGHATFFGMGAYCFGISISQGFTFYPALILSALVSAAGVCSARRGTRCSHHRFRFGGPAACIVD
jgi:branched-chain amino acid transport system permease protein